jgi:hypothetical protein
MYLSDNAIFFLVIFFLVYTIIYSVYRYALRKRFFKKQTKVVLKTALIWYSIAGFIFIPISISTYSTYHFQMILSGYASYFLSIGLAVLCLLLISLFSKKEKSFLFSFAYLIPGVVSLLTMYIDDTGKSISNLVAEPFCTGLLASIILILDYKFAFSRPWQKFVALGACCLGAIAISLCFPSLPE